VFVAMVINRYKSSPAVAHMEHALSSAHDSAYSPLFIQFPRTKIFAIFHYRAIMRLMQTVLYVM